MEARGVMSIKGINHVQITIPTGTEDEGRAFYCGLLGLHEIPKPDTLKGRGGFWVTTGGYDVHIGVEDDVNRLKTRAHIAYEVADGEGGGTAAGGNIVARRDESSTLLA